MKQRNSDETDITFILLTKIPMNLTLYGFGENMSCQPFYFQFNIHHQKSMPNLHIFGLHNELKYPNFFISLLFKE